MDYEPPAEVNDEADEALTTRDARLRARAIRDRWPIPRAKRRAMLDGLLAIACDDAAKPRARIAAARAVLAADALNRHLERQAEKQCRTLEVIEQIVVKRDEAERMDELRAVRHELLGG